MSQVTESAATILPASRVHRALRRRVIGGQYLPGQKLPTEREFGEEFGVSRLTVAKAMAQLVSEGLVNRHRGRGTFVSAAASGNGNGRPHGAAARPQARRVTFISPGRRGEPLAVSHGVLQGLHHVMNEAGYDVAVDFYGDLDEHLRCLAKADDPQAAAFVIWPESGEPVARRLRELQDLDFPMVLVDTRLPGVDCDCVIGDNIEGAAGMVAHLASLGHRRIAYLTERPDRFSLRDRLTGVLRGAIDAGLAPDAARVIELPSESPGDVDAAVAQALAGPLPATAIMASHDTLAMAAHRTLTDRGLRVPEDVSLAGYDDIDAASHFAGGLTSVSQDFYQMSCTAGHILLERLRGGPGTVQYQKLIHPNLRVRRSTAAPSGVTPRGEIISGAS